MNKPVAAICLAVTALCLGVAAAATKPALPRTPAAGLAITHARVIDGLGHVTEDGSVVVKEGKITAVGAGVAIPKGALVIDAHGRSVMPGFIDSHRHIIDGNPATWLDKMAAGRMQEFLDAGFTTVQSCGDIPDVIVELRKRLDDGRVQGPHLMTSFFATLSVPKGPQVDPTRVDPARVDVSRPPDRPTEAAGRIPDEQARAQVRAYKAAGLDSVKTVLTVTPYGPEVQTLKVIIDEAHKQGMKVITHAVSVYDTLGAVEAHPDSLAHTPHIGQLEPAEVKRIADAHIPMMSTLAVFLPTFAEENERVRERGTNDDAPRFRDLQPFPMNTLSSAGQGPVNARLLYDAGVVYGYGTDTTYLPLDSLKHELRALRVVFSTRDIVKIMTQNAAAVVGRSSTIGTLEPGKNADLVLLDGNPIEDIAAVTHVQAVIKDGNLVVDRRAQR